MYRLNARIAEHVVSFSTDSENIKDYICSKYWSVRIKQPANIQPDLFIHIDEGYGASFVDYKVDIITNEKQIIYKREDYIIEVDPNYRTARISVYDDFALKHALLNLYSAFISHQQWGLLIHSSCVVDKGKAYLFAGQSGAGKSTAAQLSAPREILSDEATIVKINKNEVTIFNSPFRSDTEMPYFSGHYPLAAIHILHQSLENKRLRIDKINGILQVLNKVFYWVYNPIETGKVLELCKQLVTHVDVYDLYFQKNNMFWEEIYENEKKNGKEKHITYTHDQTISKKN